MGGGKIENVYTVIQNLLSTIQKLQDEIQILQTELDTKTPYIISGSKLLYGTGQNYLVVFNLEDLCDMFKVSTEQAADFTIYVENGDNQALNQIPLGVVYNSPNKNWLWYLDRTLENNKMIRMNYVIFYSPGSTEG